MVLRKQYSCSTTCFFPLSFLLLLFHLFAQYISFSIHYNLVSESTRVFYSTLYSDSDFGVFFFAVAHTKWFGKKKSQERKKKFSTSALLLWWLLRSLSVHLTNIKYVNLWINNSSLVLLFIHKLTKIVDFNG